MPTRARSFGKLVLGSPTEMPSTVIVPFWNGSSALTHLISVDFPDPDGPQTTTTSPLATLVVQSFSAWKLGVYHLSTWLISIMTVSLDMSAAKTVRSLSLWEWVGARGYGLSIGCDPSPGSLTRSNLSLRER